MKKFIVKITLFSVAIICVINAIMLSFLFGVKDDWSIYSHEKNYVLSYDRLSALRDTNKIIIIAGSNGSFSINSRIIKEAFNMPVVNTSTHAGIGVRMQFETYKEFICKNDIVLFIPEYDDGDERLYGGSTLFRIVGTHMPSAYKKISARQWLHLYKYIGVHNKECYEHLGSGEFNSPYSRGALNEYGDIEFEREHKDSIKSYNLKGEMSVELIDYYKYIHDYVRSRGAKLIFLPPTLIESCYNNNTEQIDSVCTILNKNRIPYGAHPLRYVFPDTLYFDTPYHMTPAGASKRTEEVVEDMLRILKRRDKEKI